METPENIVTSYRNPDTDGVACGIALADLLSRGDTSYGTNLAGTWTPIFAGSFGNETLFALEWAHLSPPATTSEEALTKIADDANRVALVDTHHVMQLPKGFPCEKVRVIIDHHPKGDDAQFARARIDNRKIGAAASTLVEACDENETLDCGLAGLLAMAIVSNTLNFAAPTTTSFDKRMYEKAVAIQPLPERVIADLLESRSAVLDLGLPAALESDFKVLSTSYGQVGVSQLEIYDLIDRVDTKDARFCLRSMAQTRQVPCIFNGVDLRRRQSLVVCSDADSEHVARMLLNMPFADGYEIADGVLLRKSHFAR